MENQERREHEKLIAVLSQIVEMLRKIEHDLFWLGHNDERY